MYFHTQTPWKIQRQGCLGSYSVFVSIQPFKVDKVTKGKRKNALLASLWKAGGKWMLQSWITVRTRFKYIFGRNMQFLSVWYRPKLIQMRTKRAESVFLTSGTNQNLLASVLKLLK
jgi:hypothetical protein